MSAPIQPPMTPSSIREIIMYAFTRSAGLGEVELSDETAYMIMSILDDLWLWFNTVYGEQARLYRPPPPTDPDNDLLDDPLDPF